MVQRIIRALLLTIVLSPAWPASAETSPACRKLAEEVSKLRVQSGDSRSNRQAYESYLRADPHPGSEIDATRTNEEIDATRSNTDTSDMLHDELLKGARADGAKRALKNCEINEAKKRESWAIKPGPGDPDPKKQPQKKSSGSGWKSF